MNIIAFDLKTLPDIEGGRRLYNLHGLSDKDVANVMFHKRRQEGGDSELLRLHLQRVVVISLLQRAPDGTLSLHSLSQAEFPEAPLLQRFFATFTDSTTGLVSWNGTGFGLPVLNYRSLVHGIPAPGFWQATQGKHTDLSLALAGQHPAANVPLGEMASLLGLPGRIAAGADNLAWDRYLAGDIESLRQDSEIDLLNTYLLYLRYQLIRGQLDAPDHERQCQQLRDSLQVLDRSHLDQYLTAWSHQQA